MLKRERVPMSRSGIDAFECCFFERPTNRRSLETYEIAEQWALDKYFSEPFDATFLLTTDDTALMQYVIDTRNSRLRLIYSDSDFADKAGFRRYFENLAHEKSRKAIIVGHQENGQLVVRRPNGDWKADIDWLVNAAKESGVELLVWSCESANHASGGVVQTFRELPLLQALAGLRAESYLSTGNAFQTIAAATGLEFSFNAVHLFDIKGSVAKARSRSGDETQVPLFRAGYSQPIPSPSAVFFRDAGKYLQIPFRIVSIIIPMCLILGFLFAATSLFHGGGLGEIGSCIALGYWISMPVFGIFGVMFLVNGSNPALFSSALLLGISGFMIYAWRYVRKLLEV